MPGKAAGNGRWNVRIQKDLPVAKVQAAVNYAIAFPSEVEEALADADKTPEELRRLLPTLETHAVSDL